MIVAGNSNGSSPGFSILSNYMVFDVAYMQLQNQPTNGNDAFVVL